MKKHLFYLAAGAIALSACTSEDVVNDVATSRNAIQFENVVNKMSRATDLNTSNFRQFNVFGFYTVPGNDNHANQVFYNVPVTNDGSGVWSYSADNVRYWIPGGKYYFYAYSCGSAKLSEGKFGDYNLEMSNDMNDGAGIPATERVLEIDDYLCDYTHQHDLIVASNTGTDFEGIEGLATGNSNVSLEFKHILTKLKAKFTSSFTPEYTVIIKNVSVRNVLNYGDYNFKTGWNNVNKKDEDAPLVYLLNTKGDGPEGLTEAEKQAITDSAISVQNKKVTNKDGEEVQMTAETNTAYVIPFDYSATYGKVYINLDIDLMLGNDLVISKTLTATFEPEWNEGYSYVYNIDLSAKNLELNTIQFSTTIASWSSDQDETAEIDQKAN